MVHATLSFARNDKPACAAALHRITAQLRPVLGSYYDGVHDSAIARSVWLSHVQGFFIWAAGGVDAQGNWVTYHGLSGNQVLLFQALDAFLGMEPYLSQTDREHNVPERQRRLCDVLGKHSFRGQLKEEPDTECEQQIAQEFKEIIKRLRVGSHGYKPLLIWFCKTSC